MQWTEVPHPPKRRFHGTKSVLPPSIKTKLRSNTKDKQKNCRQRRSCTWNQDHLGIAKLWQNLAICPKKCRENVSFQHDGITSNTSPETCQVNDADSLG
jgi:hypothetical protein